MSKISLQIDKKKTYMPLLRFAEFHDEWKICTLNDVTKYVKGFAFKSDDYQDKGVRIVRVSDLSEDRIKNDNQKVYIDFEKSKVFEKYKLKAGNIVITTVGSKPELIESAVGRGIYIYNDNEGLLNQNMLKFENIKNVNNGYIIGLINTKKYQHYIKSIARGNANQANITVADLLQYQVNIPTLPEQTKIANFLTSINERIQQLYRKKELLEQYKKGVMQQLFSGKLRFKDENGNEFPDWEEKTLGDIAKIIAGGTPNTLRKEYWGGNIRWMNSGELNLKIVKEVENRITDKGLKNSSTKMIPIKCILIGLAGQGKTRGTAAMNLVELCTNQSIASIFPNYQKFVPEYLYQNIDQRYDELRGLSTGDGGRGGLNLKIIKSFKMNLPSIKEQQKIADFLSSIDAKIESTNQQIIQMQNFKKGLLQQMFVY